MGWDIWMEIDTGGKEPVEIEALKLQQTFNVGPMYSMSLGFCFRDLDKRLGSDAVTDLKSACLAMTSNPQEYIALNPESSWGSYEGALGVMQEMLEACRENPKATLRIS